MNGRFMVADLNYTLARLGHNRSVATSRNRPNQRPLYSLTCRKTDLEQTMKTLTALIILAAAIVAIPAQADSYPFKSLGQIGREQYGEDEPFQWSFVLGRYQFIGRHPDSLLTYTGTAKIDRVGKQLRLTRKIAGLQTHVFGVVRRADPGEADVLSFKWGKKDSMEMVCLVGSDLDNYPRLTCHWGRTGNPHMQPGMEAYFAQEPWDPIKP
jgi:hypothetical protein